MGQIDLYEQAARVGENTPLFDLNRAYNKGRIDERLHIINEFEARDAGRIGTRYKSATEYLKQKSANDALRGYSKPVHGNVEISHHTSGEANDVFHGFLALCAGAFLVGFLWGVIKWIT